MPAPGCSAIFCRDAKESGGEGQASHGNDHAEEQFTREELNTFGSEKEKYSSIRKRILGSWSAKPTEFLTEEACQQGADASDQGLIKSAHTFLTAHGAINFGAVQLPEPAPAPSEETAGEHGSSPKDAAPKPPPQRAIVLRLYEILRTIDFAVATEKTIRRQLEEEFSTTLQDPDSKAMVKKHVVYVIENMDTRETLEPLDLPPEEEDTNAEGKGKASEPKPLRKVIVVGAGAAGLAAASTLKKSGIDVVVLEAASTIGGRHAACTSSTDATGSSVNLGPAHWLPASLEASPASLDPIRTLARQLDMPLVDIEQGEGGQSRHWAVHTLLDGSPVSYEVMVAAERLRDSILSEAAKADGSGSKVGSIREAVAAALKALNPPKSTAAVKVEKAAGQAEAVEEAGHGKLVDADIEEDTPDAGPASKAETEANPVEKDVEKIEGKKSPKVEQQSQPEGACGEKANERANERADEKADEKVDEKQEQQAGMQATNSSTAGAEEADAATNLQRAALEWLMQLVEVEGGAELEQLPLSFLSRDVGPPLAQLALPDGHHVSGGTASRHLLQALASGLDIHLGNAVTTVAYSKAGVTIGTKSGAVYEGAAAVITLPLPCLSSPTESGITFDPPFPNWKASSLTRLSIGVQVQAVLRFEGPFWKSPSEAKPLPVGSVLGVLPDPSQGFTPLMMNVLSHSPATLAAVFSGKQARAALEKSDDDVQAAVTQTLGKMFPHAVSSCEAVQSCHVVRYSSSAAACGPMYLGMKGSADDIAATAMPLKHTVCFAGEHTVQGSAPSAALRASLLSGVREAARCWRIINVLDAVSSPDASAHVNTSLEVGDELPALEQLTRYKERAKQLEREQKEAEKKAKAEHKGAAKRKRKKEEGDDKEEEEEEEEEEEAEEEEVVKKRGRKSGSKRRVGADDDGDDAGGDRKGGKRKKKPEVRDPRDGEPGSLGEYDPLKAEKDMRRREEARQDKKLAHKAMIQASSGNLTPLWELMTNCAENLDMQQHLLHVVSQASVDVLDTISVDIPILKIIGEWLSAFCDSGSKDDHLVAAALGLLNRLPCSLAVLKSSGVAMAVRRGCGEHRSRDLRRQAEELMQMWMSKAKPAGPAAAAAVNGGAPASSSAAPPKKPAASSAAPARVPATASQPARARPQDAPASSLPSKSSKHEADVTAADAPPMTEQERLLVSQIAAAEAQILVAEEEAARMMAEVPSTAVVGYGKKPSLPQISTFDEFRNKSKSSSKGHASASAAGKSSRGSARAPGASSDNSALEGYVKKILHQEVQNGTVSKAAAHKIREKAVHKIVEREESQGRVVDAGFLMDSKKKAKIKGLVEQYLASYSKVPQSGAQ